MKRDTQTVFVGLSGGVDSSVAAARLKDQGYTVVGVFIKVWQPPFLKCNWEAERLDAMRVAAHLDIPFLTCDAEERYKQDVVDYLVREYEAGRTPNPDVMCNTHVKFGAFLDLADAHGADFVATGHYARRIDTAGSPKLFRGVDTAKDQSYFLWALTPAQLARSLFPVGDSRKEDIRKEAAERGLPTARKPDSQGVCFLGELDMRSFLQHFIPAEAGEVRTADGTVIGTHDGARFYTIGQRHGFSIHQRTTHEQPYYVTAKDICENTLIVSHERPQLAATAQSFSLTDTNWFGHAPEGDVSIQIRYRQSPCAARITTGDVTATVHPQEPCDMPAAGQSCVVYDGDECLGGGSISSVA